MKKCYVLAGGAGRRAGGLVVGGRRRRSADGPERDTGGHEQDDHDRRHVPAQRPGLAVCADPARDAGVLQLHQLTQEPGRQAWRLRPPDRLEVLRRPVQPVADRPADEPADPAGQDLRRTSARSARSTTRRSGRCSTAARSRTSSSRPAPASGARSGRSSRTRSAGSPTTSSEGKVYGRWIVAERAQREDRGLLPERRLRQGLPGRPQAGARLAGEPDRLRAELRGHRRDLRLADQPPAGVRRRHVGAADHADADRSCDRHGQGAELEAGPDHHQLGRGDGQRDAARPCGRPGRRSSTARSARVT